MIRRLLSSLTPHLAFAAWLGLASLASGAPSKPPLQPGEQLRYRVSWAVLPGAGEIKVQVEATGRDQLKVTTVTATRGLARLALPFEATAESTFDLETGRLASFHERSYQRNKHAEHIVTFDYASKQASYLRVGDLKTRPLPMPEGAPTDLITALLVTRNWELKPGESRDALVIFDDDFYELTIHALKYERVMTGMGTYQALVLQPRMEKTPPKGMFKRGSSVRVWISQDERRLPLKFEVEFNFGTGTATLEHYEAPKPAGGPDAKNPRP